MGSVMDSQMHWRGCDRRITHPEVLSKEVETLERSRLDVAKSIEPLRKSPYCIVLSLVI